MKDLVINYGAGIGIPKLVFELLTAIDKNGGAAAMTSSLKNISLDVGMEEGIGVFVIMGLVSHAITSHFVAHYYKNKIENDRLVNRYKNTDEVLAKIDIYPISKGLKNRLKTKYILPK
ncbi:hypothetical protein [uncultured Dokdonia sp.]|uniref:hypothetical protein n=1 Tax=uncultured Dokdonia sp. TaxID=575653 RepID=UPI00261B073B|nr:hypothetical protein [uncultured Dokdonia sp.]